MPMHTPCRCKATPHNHHAAPAPHPHHVQSKLAKRCGLATAAAATQTTETNRLEEFEGPSSTPTWAADHVALCDLPDLRVCVADDIPTQRAAALLRAHCFTVFPEGRSPTAMSARIRTRAEVEWTAIENKYKGTDVIFRGVPVTPINVDVPYVEGVVGDELDARYARIPPHDSTEPERVVVGTLDLNVGALPAEALRPKQANAPGTRAGYLSNVCVAPSARRKGVAKLLIESAASLAREKGLAPLYVHVVATNEPARVLYESMGFVFEAEETQEEARTRGKERRLLLRRDTP